MFDRIARLNDLSKMEWIKEEIDFNPFEKMIIRERSLKNYLGSSFLGLGKAIVVSKDILDFLDSFNLDDYKIFKIKAVSRGKEGELYTMFFLNDNSKEIDFKKSDRCYNEKDTSLKFKLEFY